MYRKRQAVKSLKFKNITFIQNQFVHFNIAHYIVLKLLIFISLGGALCFHY